MDRTRPGRCRPRPTVPSEANKIIGRHRRGSKGQAAARVRHGMPTRPATSLSDPSQSGSSGKCGCEALQPKGLRQGSTRAPRQARATGGLVFLMTHLPGAWRAGAARCLLATRVGLTAGTRSRTKVLTPINPREPDRLPQAAPPDVQPPHCVEGRTAWRQSLNNERI